MAPSNQPRTNRGEFLWGSPNPQRRSFFPLISPVLMRKYLQTAAERLCLIRGSPVFFGGQGMSWGGSICSGKLDMPLLGGCSPLLGGPDWWEESLLCGAFVAPKRFSASNKQGTHDDPSARFQASTQRTQNFCEALPHQRARKHGTCVACWVPIRRAAWQVRPPLAWWSWSS